MKQKTIKLYADTSVFGGPFDEEFSESSRLFFDQVRRGRFLLIVSAVVQAEIAPAPRAARELFEEMLAYAEIVEPADEALVLRQAYIDEGILPPASADDALHVALATVSECFAIVSWNFKHIVHFRKIPLYNAVNALHGYHAIGIFSPREVIDYEGQDI
jgi:predicted nucleic acid-binding protein